MSGRGSLLKEAEAYFTLVVVELRGKREDTAVSCQEPFKDEWYQPRLRVQRYEENA